METGNLHLNANGEMISKEEPGWKKKTLKRVEVVANRLAVQ